MSRNVIINITPILLETRCLTRLGISEKELIGKIAVDLREKLYKSFNGKQ